MLDFSKFSKTDTQELLNIMQKNTEKSDLEKYYLFSQDNTERAKIFIWCHRLLCNTFNLLEDGALKIAIGNEIKLTKKRYLEISRLLKEMYYNKIFVHRLDMQLFEIMNKDSLVNDLIDVFSVFLEREVIMSMSKLKGFVLEGKSKEEFQKIFKEKGKPIEEPEPEEELVEDIKEKEPLENKEKEDKNGL
jgi:hypothetical protein